MSRLGGAILRLTSAITSTLMPKLLHINALFAGYTIATLPEGDFSCYNSYH